MGKPQKIEQLQTLARDMVGDDGKPDLFFVTDQGIVVTISRDFDTAHKHWEELARRSPRVECALENRRTGVLASVEPDSDEPGARLEVRDDTHWLRRDKYLVV
jgi:hypothetical protein